MGNDAVMRTSEDQLNYLFELAAGNRDSDENIMVPEELAGAFSSMVYLLDQIDASWHARPEVTRSVTSSFARRVYEQLGETWGEVRPVATFGNLVQMRGYELPVLAVTTMEQLRSDLTPIAQLLDPATENLAVSKALIRADVPTTLFHELIEWIGTVLQDIFADPQKPGTFIVRIAS